MQEYVNGKMLINEIEEVESELFHLERRKALKHQAHSEGSISLDKVTLDNEELDKIIFSHKATLETLKNRLQKEHSKLPGLAPFGESNAYYFIGRDNKVDEIARWFESKKICFVSGASGSGKTSLIEAGLLTMLKDQNWYSITFRPSNNVIRDLAQSLYGATDLKPILDDLEIKDIVKSLQIYPSEILSKIDNYLAGRKHYLLIHVNQFEDVFAKIGNETLVEKLSPIKNLLNNFTNQNYIRVVITIRSDYFYALPESLADIAINNHILLQKPSITQLTDIIQKSFEREGVRLNGISPEKIADDAYTLSNPLPLISYLIYQLINPEDGHLVREITETAYNNIGGIISAIRKQADDAFSSLPPKAKRAFNSVFYKLVELDPVLDINTSRRKRVNLREFKNIPGAKLFIDTLAKKNLLVVDRDVVEVAHEAIFTYWKKLHDWIKTHRSDLILIKDMEHSAAVWKMNKQLRQYRWPHERLKPLFVAIKRIRPPLSKDQQAFIESESSHIQDDLVRYHDEISHNERFMLGIRLHILAEDDAHTEWSGVGNVHIPAAGDNNTILVPDIRWCDIKNHDGNVAFYISKYVITVKQYKAFDRTSTGGVLGNLPRVKVSWNEAQEFCAWLNDVYPHNRFPEESDWIVRLPTAKEWWHAYQGTGNEKRKYPWNGTWDSSRANTQQSELGQTVAVGMYPLGATPDGIADMYGNVWEWCLDWSSSTSAFAVALGYSWKDVPDSLNNRVDKNKMDFLRTENNLDYLGFRVVYGPRATDLAATDA